MCSSKYTPFDQGGFFEKIFFPSMYHDNVPKKISASALSWLNILGIGHSPN
jgi:hypothetical protein